MALYRIFANLFVAPPQVAYAPFFGFSRNLSNINIDLKGIMAKKIIEHQKKVRKFRKEYGHKVVGEITVDQIYGGMRGVPGLVTEPSHVDPEEGIRFRGLTLPECKARLPRASGGNEPLPEGMFWLLMTGDVPTQEQADSVSRRWAELSELPPHVVNVLGCLPAHLHPAAQLSAALTACTTESSFASEYARVSKERYWEETLAWLAKLQKKAGVDVTDNQIKELIRKTLESGQVVPGYGHAVLRKTDPRVLALLDFGLRYLPDDPNFRLVQDLYRVAPPILREVKKIRNPSPNADSIVGIMFKHFDINDPGFFLVFSCVGRAIGVATSLVWSRVMGLPIERPNSNSTDGLMKLVGAV